MPRLRIPTDIYNRAKTLAGRDGATFRAWAKAKALKYNGGPISCGITRSASVVVQIDVCLPAETVRSAIVAAVGQSDAPHKSWSAAAIDGVISAERFWGRECDRERAIKLLDARLKERVSEIENENKKTHGKAVNK